jgi:hypothetical protein
VTLLSRQTLAVLRATVTVVLYGAVGHESFGFPKKKKHARASVEASNRAPSTGQHARARSRTPPRRTRKGPTGAAPPTVQTHAFLAAPTPAGPRQAAIASTRCLSRRPPTDTWSRARRMTTRPRVSPSLSALAIRARPGSAAATVAFNLAQKY